MVVSGLGSGLGDTIFLGSYPVTGANKSSLGLGLV